MKPVVIEMLPVFAWWKQVEDGKLKETIKEGFQEWDHLRIQVKLEGYLMAYPKWLIKPGKAGWTARLVGQRAVLPC